MATAPGFLLTAAMVSLFDVHSWGSITAPPENSVYNRGNRTDRFRYSSFAHPYL